jgi:phage terminase large subunit-like protein
MARLGRQTPTKSVILPYEKTKGQEAAEAYRESGKEAMEWQQLLLFDLLALNEEDLWVHTKFGYSIPRRNGKNEVVSIRELWGMQNGEHILHTAHRTTTSSSASKRLAQLLTDSGYTEVQRVDKNKTYEKAYVYAKQFGLEKITLLDTGGICDFRTRTSKGGLGEGFDLLIIDEAQEYTDDQETSLKYVVSDSPNPQTIFCGTPPTTVSNGTVFQKMRTAVLTGGTVNTGWAEWSVDAMSDVNDRGLWYECNPSMGTILTERKVLDEIGNDDIDFNIQRLGLWLRYNQKSAITPAEWNALRVETVPELKGNIFVGIKYGRDGKNVALSVACKTNEEKVFTESIACKDVRAGNGWIIQFLSTVQAQTVVIDGASGQTLLSDDLRAEHIKAIALPTVKEIIEANALFEQLLYSEGLCHAGQPSLTYAVTNCEKRLIGSNGGFGYTVTKPDSDSCLMDSMILAAWACSKGKEKRKQLISY